MINYPDIWNFSEGNPMKFSCKVTPYESLLIQVAAKKAGINWNDIKGCLYNKSIWMDLFTRFVHYKDVYLELDFLYNKMTCNNRNASSYNEISYKEMLCKLIS